MDARARALLCGIALSLCLAGCGGGSSGTSFGGGGTTTPGPGSLSIAPTSLTFTGPGAAAQTFTVTSTIPNEPAPAINASGCSPVATIATTSTTLPATYTVTPTANGTCSFTADLGRAEAAIGITVGPAGGSITGPSSNAVTLYVGGTAGSVSVSSPSGSFSTDTTACNGIATVSQISNSGGTAVYQISPAAAGSCQFVITSGASSFTEDVTVNPTPSGAAALTVAPTSMTFSNATASAPQQGTLNFSGPVGAVVINESDCTGGANGTAKAKLAFLTINNANPGAPVSLPASFTVTLYGSGATGTCSIVFTPQNGSSATLAVTVNP
ncbi:MAG TPA: hypothetical protein VHT53_09075 [Candidatus Elarobacter sp.]|jgi:hypothetical protein|nr:hypothetical protein [Candidatus Elarobacter sp.]